MLKHNNKEISDKRVYKDVVAAHVTFMLISLHLVYISTIRPSVHPSVRPLSTLSVSIDIEILIHIQYKINHNLLLICCRLFVFCSLPRFVL